MNELVRNCLTSNFRNVVRKGGHVEIKFRAHARCDTVCRVAPCVFPGSDARNIDTRARFLAPVVQISGG